MLACLRWLHECEMIDVAGIPPSSMTRFESVGFAPYDAVERGEIAFALAEQVCHIKVLSDFVERPITAPVQPFNTRGTYVCSGSTSAYQVASPIASLARIIDDGWSHRDQVCAGHMLSQLARDPEPSLRLLVGGIARRNAFATERRPPREEEAAAAPCRKQ